MKLEKSCLALKVSPFDLEFVDFGETPCQNTLQTQRHCKTSIMYVNSGPVTCTRHTGCFPAVHWKGTGNVYIQGIKGITAEWCYSSSLSTNLNMCSSSLTHVLSGKRTSLQFQPFTHIHPSVVCTLGTCLTPLALVGFDTIKLSPRQLFHSTGLLSVCGMLFTFSEYQRLLQLSRWQFQELVTICASLTTL